MDFSGDILVPRRVFVFRLPILHQFFVATKKNGENLPTNETHEGVDLQTNGSPGGGGGMEVGPFFSAEKTNRKIGKKNGKNGIKILEEMCFGGWWQLNMFYFLRR